MKVKVKLNGAVVTVDIADKAVEGLSCDARLTLAGIAAASAGRAVANFLNRKALA